MAATCLTCAHAALRGGSAAADKTRRQFAEHGCVCCTVSYCAATFKPFDSRCERFASVDEKTAASRTKWAQARTETHA
jgi:hypothetical protein